MCNGFLYLMLQSKTEKTGYSSPETEATSSKKTEEIFHGKDEHEIEQETNDPIRDDVDDNNKASSELAITQVKLKLT